VEYFLVVIVETFEDDEVSLWLIHSNNIDNLILVRNLEGQDLLANLTVHFVELEHYLAPVYLPLSLGLKPGAKTLQMNRALCASAFAGRDERVRLLILAIFALHIFCFRPPTNLANCLL